MMCRRYICTRGALDRGDEGGFRLGCLARGLFLLGKSGGGVLGSSRLGLPRELGIEPFGRGLVTFHRVTLDRVVPLYDRGTVVAGTVCH
jgi:hypothetical protein